MNTQWWGKTRKDKGKTLIKTVITQRWQHLCRTSTKQSTHKSHTKQNKNICLGKWRTPWPIFKIQSIQYVGYIKGSKGWEVWRAHRGERKDIKIIKRRYIRKINHNKKNTIQKSELNKKRRFGFLGGLVRDGFAWLISKGEQGPKYRQGQEDRRKTLSLTPLPLPEISEWGIPPHGIFRPWARWDQGVGRKPALSGFRRVQKWEALEGEALGWE